MWKKILWIVTVLYPVGFALIIIANTSGPISDQIPSFLIFLIPLGVLIFELRDGKTPKIWGKIPLIIAYPISFLLLGVAIAGYYSDPPTWMSLFNIVKGLPFLITLLALFYFAFKRVFRRRA